MRLGITFDDVLLIPQYSEIKSRKDVYTFTDLSNNISLEIPIISANMDTVTESSMANTMRDMGGLGAVHRFMSIERQTEIVKELYTFHQHYICAAIGIHNEDKERTKSLFDAGMNIALVDIAHGDSKSCADMVLWIRLNFSYLDIIAGNICTPEGALRLVNAGANIIKVGVGAGSICTTRVISGYGVPQLTAIMDVAEVLKYKNVSIIADGGIRGSNDIVKALAAGADAVMLGNLLSGTEETPGEIVKINNKLYKSYRGMASKSANKTRRNLDAENYAFDSTPEGVESLVEYKGSCRKIIEKLVGGLRSGMSYAGAYSIKDLQENAEFIQITNSGIKESNYHDVEVIN